MIETSQNDTDKKVMQMKNSYKMALYFMKITWGKICRVFFVEPFRSKPKGISIQSHANSLIYLINSLPLRFGAPFPN